MCKYVVRVKFKAQSESPQLITFDDAEAMEKRVAELQNTDTVAALQVFNLAHTLARTERWEKT